MASTSGRGPGRKARRSTGKAKTPEISVVVPVLNEEGNIVPLVDGILEAFRGRALEIIYVNDGSTDGSARELSALQKRVPELRVLAHSERAGQSQSLRTGILAARAPLIATLDGDGQNPPGDLVALEAAVRKNRPGPVMAAGYRARRRDGFSKRYASLFARWARRALLSDSHPDTGCATKVFDRDLYLRLPYFDHMHRFLPPLARREGAKVLALPVGHAPRVAGRSKYRTLDRLSAGISDIMGVMWLIRRRPKQRKATEFHG